MDFPLQIFAAFFCICSALENLDKESVCLRLKSIHYLNSTQFIRLEKCLSQLLFIFAFHYTDYAAFFEMHRHRQTRAMQIPLHSCLFTSLFFILANKISLKQFSEWIELNTHCVTHWWSSWIIRNANRSKQMKMRQRERGQPKQSTHWCWLLYVRLHCWL